MRWKLVQNVKHRVMIRIYDTQIRSMLQKSFDHLDKMKNNNFLKQTLFAPGYPGSHPGEFGAFPFYDLYARGRLTPRAEKSVAT